MAVLDQSRSRHGACLKRFFGFSTPVRNGTCCRRAIRTTKQCIGAFRRGAADLTWVSWTKLCERMSLERS